MGGYFPAQDPEEDCRGLSGHEAVPDIALPQISMEAHRWLCTTDSNLKTNPSPLPC